MRSRADKAGEADETDGVMMDEEASESGSVAEVLGCDDDQPPAESPQQTRASTVMAVQLAARR